MDLDFLIPVLFSIAVGIALLIAIIKLWIYLANHFYNAAVDKGYNSRAHFWIPFWLGAVGYAIVIALPDKKTREAINRLTDAINNSGKDVCNAVKSLEPSSTSSTASTQVPSSISDNLPEL